MKSSFELNQVPWRWIGFASFYTARFRVIPWVAYNQDLIFMWRLCLYEVFVTCNSLKTIATDKLYQRIDFYCCMLVYTQSLVWRATRPHYSLNFGWKKKTTYDYTRLYIYNNEKTSQR